MDKRNKVFVTVGTVAILSVVGFVGYGLFFSENSSGSDATGNTVSSSYSTSTDSSVSSSSSSSSSSTTSTSYKDGTYTSTQSYRVPHGSNTIKATVVIYSGKISSASSSNSYSDGESASYVASFESYLSSDAVGQSLATYSPSRIGGASLTTMAFDDALADIQSQALGS